MANVKPVRGTHDVLPEQYRRHRLVTETARAVSARYGYEQVATPVFESTDVFARTLGDTSDIVTKEMYTFADRSDGSLTLRPEYTAGICRAFISNGLGQHLPLKFFAHGPMFRYERPQKGRQRQFHQIDIELLGVEKPIADIEVIAVGAQILDSLGVSDKVELELNTLGDTESRDAYRAMLVEYLSDYKGQLSEESLLRLEKNPLRILDSKDENDRKIVADAPLLVESLNSLSEDFFDEVKSGLEDIGITYKINPRLVRGMDYYSHTAFEFVTNTLGSQGAVIAGGRYDGLIKVMGGPQTPGIGWAGGIERLAMMLEDTPELPRPVSVIPVSSAQEKAAFGVAEDLRRAGFTIDLGYTGNMKKRLIRANKANASVAVLLGEDELARGAATVRDMETGSQEEVALSALEGHLKPWR